MDLKDDSKTVVLSVYHLNQDRVEIRASYELECTPKLWSINQNRIVFILSNGSVSLNDSVCGKFKHDAYYLKWHPLGTIFVIGFINQRFEHEFCLFDCGFNPLVIEYDQQYPSMTSKKLIGSNSRILEIDFHSTDGYKTTNIFIKYEKGPLCIVKIGTHTCDSKQIIKMQLSRNKTKEAYRFIQNYHEAMIENLEIFMDYLLRHMNYENMNLMSEIMKKHGSERSFQNHMRRFFIQMLRLGFYEKSFEIAQLLENTEMYEDIYHYAKKNGHIGISMIAYLKTSSGFQLNMSVYDHSTFTKNELSELTSSDKKTHEEILKLAAIYEVEGRLDKALELVKDEGDRYQKLQKLVSMLK